MSRTDAAPARGRASAIDGFRGLAALSTVAFHVWQQYFRYDAQGSHPPVDNPVLGAAFSSKSSTCSSCCRRIC